MILYCFGVYVFSCWLYVVSCFCGVTFTSSNFWEKSYRCYVWLRYIYFFIFLFLCFCMFMCKSVYLNVWVSECVFVCIYVYERDMYIQNHLCALVFIEECYCILKIKMSSKMCITFTNSLKLLSGSYWKYFHNKYFLLLSLADSH